MVNGGCKCALRLGTFLIIGMFCFGVFVWLFITDMARSSQEYKDNQEAYFASSEYHIRGKVSMRKYLGGGTFLLKIKADSVSLVSTIDSKDAEYAGLYNERLSLVYFLTDNSNWDEEDPNWIACKDSNWIACRGVERPILPINITIDSNLRKVIYDTPDTTYEMNMRSYHVYTKYLEKYKKNVEYDYDESVRF